MKFGIDRLVGEPALRTPLAGRRIALLAHPASVTEDLTHALDALAACGDIKAPTACPTSGTTFFQEDGPAGGGRG
jgi:uncharacterized protein YbbC (DUF1343 family)